MAKVTREELQQIATLSKLFIAQEDEDALLKEMDSIIAFADTINQAVSDGDTDFDNINGLSNVFRADEVIPSIAQEDVLKNAPEAANGSFLVRPRR